MMMKRTAIFIVCFCFWMESGMALANENRSANSVQSTKQLKQLDNKIQKLQLEIKNDQGKKGQLSQQLLNNMAKLKKLQHQQAILSKDLHKQETRLNSIQKKQQDYQQQLQQQVDLTNKQMLLTYELMLLEPAQPLVDPNREQMDFLLAYNEYLDHEQLTELQSTQQTLSILGSESKEMSNHKNVLQSLLNKQEKPAKKLTLATESQKQALNNLATQIQSKNQKLKELVANRKALDSLLKKLETEQNTPSKSNQPRFIPTGASFNSSQGRLPWPIRGNVTHHFGDPIEQSGLKYTGILIATQGSEVHAVAPGKVIFANFLQGLGLLLIIDHGNGYMTLYGHNELLFKGPGDEVKAGEIVANLAKSREIHSSELYFEVRRNGQPLNPLEWLLSKG